MTITLILTFFVMIAYFIGKYQTQEDTMKILFIDDMPERLRQVFELTDEIVFVTHQPNEIEFYLTNYKIDLICLDNDMPVKDGYEIAKEYLIERSIPILIITGNVIARKRIAELLKEYYVPYMIFLWFDKENPKELIQRFK